MHSEEIMMPLSRHILLSWLEQWG